MIFGLDERGWELQERLPTTWIDSLESVLDLIDDLIERGHSLGFSESFFLQPIVSGLTFYELYSDSSPIAISSELQTRIAVIFARAVRFDEISQVTGGFDVGIDSRVVRAEAIAWAASRYLSDRARISPCISCVSQGLLNVSYDNRIVPIWLVKSPSQVENFFRWMIRKETRSPAEMEALSSEAFRQLEFVEGAIDGIKGMSGAYTSLIDKIVEDLGFLSDHGSAIFGESWQEAPGKFLKGSVDISDENGKTKRDGAAAKQRKIQYEGVDRYFWWHIKLQAHQNRIHICPDKVKDGGQIIVGIFCLHLK